MAVTSYEIAGSPFYPVRGSNDSRTVPYIARGTEDENEVLDHAFANTPSTWDGMDLEDFDVNQLSNDNWQVDAKYSRQPKKTTRNAPSGGTIEEQWEISTQSSKIYSAYSDVNVFGAAIDVNEAVGFDMNTKRVEGIDALVPQIQFAVNIKVPRGYTIGGVPFPSSSYVSRIEGVVGTVNQATFRGRAAGEVFFAGVNGNNTDNESTLSFRFLVRKNFTTPSGYKIAGVSITTGTVIKGWDIIYPIFKETEDATIGRIKSEAVSVIHQRIYKDGDFSLLGL